MTTQSGKQAEFGLRPTSSLPLATARRLAGEMREAVALGGDPRIVLASAEPQPSSVVPTFGDFAESYIASVESGWRNPVHRQQWRSSLRDHAACIRDKSIDRLVPMTCWPTCSHFGLLDRKPPSASGCVSRKSSTPQKRGG
jgi:hypothetical protein